MPIEKSKAIGKIIILILCCTILLFLLLPFLDGSSQAQSDRQSARKATPLIATLNPLREMAQKILTAFGSKPQVRHKFMAAAEAPLQASRQGASSSIGTQESALSTAGQEVTDTSADMVDNAQAAFVNEEGEWVLINQIEPISSNRGMHDINSSDSAYDKLIRLERQAKYTGHPRRVAEKSVWEQLWDPFKEMFSSSETPKQAPVGPLGSSDNASRQQTLAMATSSRSSQPHGSSASQQTERGNPLSTEEANKLLALLLDPNKRLDNNAEQLKQMARDLLPSKQALSVSKQIDEDTKKAKNWVEEQLALDLARKAEGQSAEELASKAITCFGSATPVSLYKDLSGGACKEYTPMSPSAGLDKQVQALYEKNKQDIVHLLNRLTEQNMENVEIPAVVYLGKTKAGESFMPKDPKELEFLDPSTRIYLKWLDELFKSSGCEKEDCYLVSIDPSLQSDLAANNKLKAGGTIPTGVPAKVQIDKFNSWIEEEMATAPEEDLPILQSTQNMVAHYMMLTNSQMKEFVDGKIVVAANDALGIGLYNDKTASAGQLISGNFEQSKVSLATDGEQISGAVQRLLERENDLTNKAAKTVADNNAPQIYSSWLSGKLKNTPAE